MIPGIITQGEFYLYSSPPTTSALGSFDFVNGTYDWNGTSLAASDVTDKTAWIGASGLQVPGSDSAGASILYSATRTLLASCDFTAVCEFEAVKEVAHYQHLLVVCSEYYSDYINLFYDNGQLELEDQGTSGRSVFESTHATTNGTYKIAVSRGNDQLSISVGGFAAEVTTDGSITMPVGGEPMFNYYLGGWPSYTDKAVNIHWIKFYERQSDSNLAILSA